MRRPERDERFKIAAVSESGLLRNSNCETQDLDDDPTVIAAQRPLGGLASSLPPPRLSALPPPPPVPRFRNAPAASPVTELREGAVLSDQYVVERVVGNMGSCVMVKVRHARLGQRFHLKHLRAEACKNPEAIRRFLSAARAAMNLRSEHTARTVDAGRLPSGAPYVVSEAFQGSELREILRVRGALTPTEAVDFVLQASEAVAEAHRQGLTHGCLSPSTLFATRRSDGLPLIKVLEFGNSETLRGNPLGVQVRSWNHGTAAFWESSRLWDTLAYSAPEQLRMADPTPLSDVWALGATLHELLSGAPAFHAESASSLLAAVVADAPAPLTSLCSGLPRELETIVLRCLSKEPHGRYASVADLAAALRGFASAEAQLSVDRIARIQSFDPQQAPLSASTSRSIVRVGPSPSASASASATTPPQPARLTGPNMVSAFATTRPLAIALLGSAVLAALGVLGGTIAGAAVASSALGPARTPAAALTPAATSTPLPERTLALAPTPPPSTTPTVQNTPAPTATIVAPVAPVAQSSTPPRRAPNRPGGSNLASAPPRSTAGEPSQTAIASTAATTSTASSVPAKRSGLFDQMD